MAKSISRRLADSASPTGAIDGTLSTAAQTNITSVGTLSALAVTGDLTVDTSTLKVDSTNNRVGIGTSSPNSLAHVYGGSSGRSWTPDGADKLALEHNDSVVFDIRTPNNKQGLILFSDADARARGIMGYAHASDHMYFNTAGTERLRIDSSGNVSIGTASSPQTFNVLGTHENAGFYRDYSASGVGATYLQIGRKDSNGALVSGVRISGGGDDGVAASHNGYFEIATRKAGTFVSLLSSYSGGSELVVNETSVDMDFRVESDGSTHAFFVQGSDGNVGIGTASPTLAGTGYRGLSLVGPTGQGSSITLANSAGHVTYLYTERTGDDFLIEATGDLVLRPGGAEGMRVTSAGKVVVDGTVAGYSGTQLTVGSPSIVTSGLSVLSTTSGHGYLMFGDATGDASGGYVGQIHYGHSSNSMDIVTNGVKACEWDNDGLQISNQVLADGRRRGMYGIYSPIKIAHIWGMGTAYKIAADGSTGGNLYGLCYTYEPNYETTGTNPGARNGLGHQMQWRSGGTTQTAIGTGIYTIATVTANSDARLKTDIETIPNAMSKVSALTGITYKRTDLSEVDPATGFQYDVRHTGVLAQDLLAVLPEAVEGAVNGQQPEDGSYLSVAYGNMAGLFVEALKEQQATIEALTQRLETLENN